MARGKNSALSNIDADRPASLVRLKVVGGDDHADTVNKLRDMAEDAADDPSIKGVIIIIERDGGVVSFVNAGRFRSACERAYYALHKVAHAVLHKDGL